MIIERGMKQGIKDSTIESILVLLDRRFEINTAPVLTPLLDPIDDLQKLKHLFQEAIIVEHLEDFILTVQNTQNGT